MNGHAHRLPGGSENMSNVHVKEMGPSLVFPVLHVSRTSAAAAIIPKCTDDVRLDAHAPKPLSQAFIPEGSRTLFTSNVTLLSFVTPSFC